jgi:BNR repeat-containing family member
MSTPQHRRIPPLRAVAALLGLFLLLSSSSVYAARTSGPTAAVSAASTLTQYTSDGAWCWFQDPRAIHYQGLYNKTYVGWVTSHGDVMISSYNHTDGTTGLFTLHAAFQADDHVAPSILVRSDGRLVAFYSRHSGANMWYRIAVNPEDISAWGPERRVGVNTAGPYGYTYSNPFQLTAENGQIYLFWRGGNYEPTMATSSDNAQTWSAATTVINVPGQRPYVKYASNGTDTIHFAFTNGHPAETPTTSIFYAYYRGGAYYRADGTLITPAAGLPFTPAQADTVYDGAATGVKSWIWDIALDSAGNPVIVYATFPSTTNHMYRYARWTGTGWLNYDITAAGGYIDGPSQPYYSGGVELDHANPSTVYLSRQINGIHEIEKWTTPDGGATWTSVAITSGSAKKNVRPIVPWGPTAATMNVLWMSGDYPSYTSYNTALDAYPAPAPPAPKTH